ncbi:methylthioribulose 1-phosphate dehydratase MDE1 [Sugiyamaella lignohabitans]|uniref:Methylthioribulose 1-phosphate dehydratase MDE1 n=1 Tax=Sugiyamaella lignohabitans TaxID=796027 RepID=A0A167CHI8_9ASCO|nr:methylthioribulose 1-phosphate dehydratase MDE1 [Sugiyamaella lignohabitans]ANB11706.1 methylthioribulose 1-phosphate dehydratase MDE1 [Sugiyamaella lignohabitans]
MSVDEATEKYISSDEGHPAAQISSLCRLFYEFDWVPGTGGGMSIRQGDLVYLAPSGVEKEVCFFKFNN